MTSVLSYQVSFGRLQKLGRSMGRRAYRTVWLLTWLLVALLLAAVLGLVVFGETLRDWLETARIPADVEVLFIIVAVLFLVGIYMLTRMRASQVKGRANFNQTIRLMQDDGGLRFVTEEVEHYLKWQGISQLLLEHDGVVVSHGNLFFLVPDDAFPS